MPLIQITLAGDAPATATVQHVQAETTRLMRDILRKEAALTVVSVSHLPAGQLAVDGRAVSRGAWLQASITAGTNSEVEKAAFIAAADGLLRQAAGGSEVPVYIVVQEVPAGDWGYDGRTQAARRAERLAGSVA